MGAGLVSCNQDEQDDLAKAQQCLDDVPQTNPEAASDCFHYVDKHDSQQAKILKCSILMTSGGMIESKVVAAYNALKNQGNNNREAAFMSVLALNKPDVTSGYAKAQQADVFCQATGVPGLRYISGLVVAGSFMANAINSYASGTDFNDPAALASAATTLLGHCTATPRDVECPTDLSVIGQTATTLADSYCASAKPDDEVCSNISVAVEQAGGDPAKAGAALFCYLNNKTFNPATGDCN